MLIRLLLFIQNTKEFNQQRTGKLIHGKIYVDFDISLLYTILRYICGIHEHKNGWGDVPLPTDRIVSANIERIRLIRNEYGHSAEFSLSDIEFKRKWQDIQDS